MARSEFRHEAGSGSRQTFGLPEPNRRNYGEFRYEDRNSGEFRYEELGMWLLVGAEG